MQSRGSELGSVGLAETQVFFVWLKLKGLVRQILPGRTTIKMIAEECCKQKNFLLSYECFLFSESILTFYSMILKYVCRSYFPSGT